MGDGEGRAVEGRKALDLGRANENMRTKNTELGIENVFGRGMGQAKTKEGRRRCAGGAEHRGENQGRNAMPMKEKEGKIRKEEGAACRRRGQEGQRARRRGGGEGP